MLIDRYIQKMLGMYLLATLLVFYAIQIILSFSSELNSIGQGQYTLWLAVKYTLLASASLSYQTFSFVALLASLLTLNQLHKQHELTVMRVGGMSIYELSEAILKAGILATVCMTFVGEICAPRMTQWATRLKISAVGHRQVMRMPDGIWLHDHGQFIYIQKIEGEEKLHNISRYAINHDQQQLNYDHAQSGHVQDGHWVFNNVNQIQYTSGRFERKHFALKHWPVSFNHRLILAVRMLPEQLNLKRYWLLLNERQRAGMSTPQQNLLFWQRAFEPLLTLAMFLLAIPFAISSIRQAHSSLKTILGCLLGVGCYFATRFLATVVLINGVSANIAAGIPVALMMMLAIFGIWHEENKWRFSQKWR